MVSVWHMAELCQSARDNNTERVAAEVSIFILSASKHGLQRPLDASELTYYNPV